MHKTQEFHLAVSNNIGIEMLSEVSRRKAFRSDTLIREIEEEESTEKGSSLVVHHCRAQSC